MKSALQVVDCVETFEDPSDENLSATLLKVVQSVGDDLWKLPFFGKFIDDGYNEPSFVSKLQFEALQSKVQIYYPIIVYMCQIVCD